MKPYEKMVKFTPQTEWIEGKGILLWLAFFFIELGAGIYIMSIILGSNWGMLIGWLVCLVLGGGCHLAFLGKPLRFYFAFLRPQTSWISRGLIFISIFAVIGAAHLAVIRWAPDTNPIAFEVIMVIISFLVVLYGGLAMSYVRALPLWNTAIVPILYTAASLWGGAGIVLGIMLVRNEGIEDVEVWIRMFLIGFFVIILLYLWGTRYASASALQSIRRFIRGDLILPFYLGVVIIGIVLPAIVVAYSFAAGVESTPTALFVVAIACEFIGDLTMRYCILKGGLYSSLIVPSPGY
jgi:formate-dependent nitrite reductase membrane component NrfD